MSIVPPGVALIVTFRGSNYRCLEQIFMVPKRFEPSKFDCSFLATNLVFFSFFFFFIFEKWKLEFCHLFYSVYSLLFTIKNNNNNNKKKSLVSWFGWISDQYAEFF